MNKLFFSFLLFTCVPAAMVAQSASKVGVNTREPSENLHVKGTVRVEQLPNNGTPNSIFTDPTTGKGATGRTNPFNAQNMVVADKNGVLGVIRGVANWFYMPSINISTEGAPNKTLDLYAEFKKQFATPLVKSAGAPAAIIATTNLPAKTDLYYYITDYDTNVLSNVSINADGVMSYTVAGSPEPTSYVNIVFVLK